MITDNMLSEKQLHTDDHKMNNEMTKERARGRVQKARVPAEPHDINESMKMPCAM